MYGDFNDTRPSTAFKTLTGTGGVPGALTVLPLKDRHDEAWTHYWAAQDIYSRFDYITVAPALKSEVDLRASRVIDDAAWADASDHRPLLAVFR